MADILRTHPFVRGGVLIDIGVNIGTTSIPRLLLGEVDCVYGAEPELANVTCLRRTLAENHLEGRVLVDRVAIGAVDSDAYLQVASRVGAHRLLLSPVASRKAVRVPCLTLDSWSGRLGPDLERVTYIKCDTQGWEGHVLAGASHMLRRKDVVWEMEICPGLLLAAGTQLDDLCRVLAGEFRWFVDLRAIGRGMAERPTADLESTVRAGVGRDRNYTNVLLFNQS
jgi:FkbM family methyltransferase